MWRRKHYILRAYCDVRMAKKRGRGGIRGEKKKKMHFGVADAEEG